MPLTSAVLRTKSLSQTLVLGSSSEVHPHGHETSVGRLVRIVSLIPSATEMVAALGLEHALVGITHSCDFPPSVQHLPHVTSTAIAENAKSREIDQAVKESLTTGASLYVLDVELLERLRPDLVITQGVCDVCAVGETQALTCLSDLTSRPVLLSLHTHRLDDVMSDLVRIGGAGGVESRARELVDEYRTRVQRVVRRVEHERTVSVVVLEWIDPPFSAGHWTPDLVNMAGGCELLAIAGARSRELTWDEVLEADPEVLVLACCGQDVARTLEDLTHLEARPGFGDLRAVRTEKIYVADGGAHFSRPGPRLVESIEMLAETLHPSGRNRSRLSRARPDSSRGKRSAPPL